MQFNNDLVWGLLSHNGIPVIGLVKDYRIIECFLTVATPSFVDTFKSLVVVWSTEEVLFGIN